MKNVGHQPVEGAGTSCSVTSRVGCADPRWRATRYGATAERRLASGFLTSWLTSAQLFDGVDPVVKRRNTCPQSRPDRRADLAGRPCLGRDAHARGAIAGVLVAGQVRRVPDRRGDARWSRPARGRARWRRRGDQNICNSCSRSTRTSWVDSRRRVAPDELTDGRHPPSQGVAARIEPCLSGIDHRGLRDGQSIAGRCDNVAQALRP